MELIQGKYYYAEHSIDNYVIFQASAQGTGCAEGVRYKSEYYKNNSWAIKKETIRLATEKEIEWLCECRQTGKYITPSQLLGETEERNILIEEAKRRYPVGTRFMSNNGIIRTVKSDLVILNTSGRPCIEVSEFNDTKHNTACVFYNNQWAEIIPEEIPQEEVEYVECLDNSGGSFTKGKVYKVRRPRIDSCNNLAIELDDKGSNKNGWGEEKFKPSTREAYETQQGVQVAINISGDIVDSLKSMYKEVNKCSTINTNQNESNEKQSVKVQRVNLKTGITNPIRGLGLKGSGNKIKLGSNDRYNQTRFSSCKA